MVDDMPDSIAHTNAHVGLVAPSGNDVVYNDVSGIADIVIVDYVTCWMLILLLTNLFAVVDIAFVKA